MPGSETMRPERRSARVHNVNARGLNKLLNEIHVPLRRLADLFDGASSERAIRFELQLGGELIDVLVVRPLKDWSDVDKFAVRYVLVDLRIENRPVAQSF